MSLSIALLLIHFSVGGCFQLQPRHACYCMRTDWLGISKLFTPKSSKGVLLTSVPWRGKDFQALSWWSSLARQSNNMHCTLPRQHAALGAWKGGAKAGAGVYQVFVLCAYETHCKARSFSLLSSPSYGIGWVLCWEARLCRTCGLEGPFPEVPLGFWRTLACFGGLGPVWYPEGLLSSLQSPLSCP